MYDLYEAFANSVSICYEKPELRLKQILLFSSVLFYFFNTALKFSTIIFNIVLKYMVFIIISTSE